MQIEDMPCFFLGANAPKGYFSRFDQLFAAAPEGKCYLLKGGPGTGKSTVLKKTAAVLGERGLSTELILCSADPDSLDAVMTFDGKFVMADATLPHSAEPKYPGVYETTVSLSDFWDGEKLFKEGKTVTFYYDLIATDTDYRFDVLGVDDYELGYSDDKGYSITFVMPANDVTVSVDSKNSMMVYEPEYETVPGELLFDYYRATSAVGGGHYEITLYTAESPNFIELCQ